MVVHCTSDVHKTMLFEIQSICKHDLQSKGVVKLLL